MKKDKKPLRARSLLVVLALISGLALSLSHVFAGNISLNSSVPVEFGQGRATTTNCTSGDNLIITPGSRYSSTDSKFYLSSFSLTHIPATCWGKSFTFQVYDTTGSLMIENGSTQSSVSATYFGPDLFSGDGVVSHSSGISTSDTSADGYYGAFTLTLSSPAALANSTDGSPTVSKVVVQSGNGSQLCPVNDVANHHPNGIYSLTINGTLESVYCLTDPTVAGGGWMLAMKAPVNSDTFGYYSTYWTTSDLLNSNDVGPLSSQINPGSSTFDEDAKYDVFDSYAASNVLVIYPDVNSTNYPSNYQGGAIPDPTAGHDYGYVWNENLNSSQPLGSIYSGGAGSNCPNSATTLLNLFSTSSRCLLRNISYTYNPSENPYSVIGNNVFSSQPDIDFFGFNYTSPSHTHDVRFGVAWNENGPYIESSDDDSGGIGNSNGWSAGDNNGGFQSNYEGTGDIGISSSLAMELFVK